MADHRVAHIVRGVAQALLVERMHVGQNTEGYYFKPSRGAVEYEGSPAVPGQAFVWCIPPPSGDETMVFDKDGVQIEDGSQFYACETALYDSKRLFVFLPPIYAIRLKDNEVSWYFQKRMTDLTPAERSKEHDFRESKNLKFPLEIRPE